MKIIRPGPGEYQPGPAGIPQSGPTGISKGSLEGKSRPGRILLIRPSRVLHLKKPSRGRPVRWRRGPNRGRCGRGSPAGTGSPAGRLARPGGEEVGPPGRWWREAWEEQLARWPSRGKQAGGPPGDEEERPTRGRARPAQPVSGGKPGHGAEGPGGTLAGPAEIGAPARPDILAYLVFIPAQPWLPRPGEVYSGLGLDNPAQAAIYLFFNIPALIIQPYNTH
jgi:hypothetical protein